MLRDALTLFVALHDSSISAIVRESSPVYATVDACETGHHERAELAVRVCIEDLTAAARPLSCLREYCCEPQAKARGSGGECTCEARRRPAHEPLSDAESVLDVLLGDSRPDGFDSALLAGLAVSKRNMHCFRPAFAASGSSVAPCGHE